MTLNLILEARQAALSNIVPEQPRGVRHCGPRNSVLLLIFPESSFQFVKKKKISFLLLYLVKPQIS